MLDMVWWLVHIKVPSILSPKMSVEPTADRCFQGYGLGSGISLFIATNICETIVWKAKSFDVWCHLIQVNVFHVEVKLREFHVFARVNERTEVQIDNFIEQKDLRTARYMRGNWIWSRLYRNCGIRWLGIVKLSICQVQATCLFLDGFKVF